MRDWARVLEVWELMRCLLIEPLSHWERGWGEGSVVMKSRGGAEPSSGSSSHLLPKGEGFDFVRCGNLGGGAVGSGTDQQRVLGQRAAADLRRGWLPVGATCDEVGVGNDLAAGGVDHDAVAFVQQRDRPAACRLRCDVADHEAVGGAGETAVGDQRHVVAEAAA